MTRKIRITRHATAQDLPKVIAKIKYKKARERATGPSEGLRLCGNCKYWKTKSGAMIAYRMKDKDPTIVGFCLQKGIPFTGKRRKARQGACYAFKEI